MMVTTGNLRHMSSNLTTNFIVDRGGVRLDCLARYVRVCRLLFSSEH